MNPLRVFVACVRWFTATELHTLAAAQARRIIILETQLSTMTHARDVADGHCRLLRRQVGSLCGHPSSDGWLSGGLPVGVQALGGDDELHAWRGWSA